jgi:predicted phosphodiesterase
LTAHLRRLTRGPAALWVLGLLAAASAARAQELRLPVHEGSVRFAVIGDTGTAAQAQYDIGKQMAAFHQKFPFTFVIMVGDNIYGTDSPGDFERKFELPYKPLLDAGVKFYAALGNHDNPNQNGYKFFNMGQQRFYTFKPAQGVRFFALDSNYMDRAQMEWLQKELTSSGSEWKIPFFHHPLYSSGRTHGSSVDLRNQLEPLFVEHGVDVVFSGHDHFYERVKPQKGIYYFVSGAGGSLRKGDIRPGTGLTEVGFDTDFSFMLVEVDGRDLYFQAIARTGQTVDSGVIHQAPGHGVEKSVPLAPGSPVPPAVVSPKPGPQPTPEAPPGTPPSKPLLPPQLTKPSPSPSATPSPSPSPRPRTKARPKAKKPPAPAPTTG